MTRDIGLDVEPPERACEDPNCPFHGDLSVRGQILKGRVASTKMDKSIVVERRRLWRLPRFERFEKRTSRLTAHRPPCIDVTIGDEVTVAECRPLSKTKSFVIVEALERRREVYGEDVGAPVIGPAGADDEDEEDESAEEDASSSEPEPSEGDEGAITSTDEPSAEVEA